MVSQEIINIAVADDHEMVRKGIVDTINFFNDLNVIIEAADGQDLMEQLKKAPILPDICIIDVNMPRLNGYKTLKEIRRNWPSIKVLIFSASYNELSISETLADGASGFLQKDCTPRQLQHALQSIYNYDFYLSEGDIYEISLGRQENNVVPHMTEREMEFLSHCCCQLHYKEIGELMKVDVHSVEAFRDALFSKLNIKTRPGLVLFALQNGIVNMERQ